MPNSKSFSINPNDSPHPDDNLYIKQMIKSFNNVVSPHHLASRQPDAVKPLSVFIRNKAGEIVGGLTADTYWEWLAIDDFWIHEDLRGQGYGTKVLKMAETEAIRRGCRQAKLATFAFQARTFYERHGYRVVGVLEDYPPDSALYWMRKDFEVD